MKWFRVYSEIKDDPKMLEMDDHQRWLWICLMSLANDSEQRGTILNVRLRGLASSLRTTEDKLREALELYQELDMAEYDEDARTITLLNFIKRQYDKPSDEPEQTRERQRVSRQRHAGVTPSHATYSDTDNTNTQTKEKDDDEGAGAPVDADTAKAFTAFQNDIHLIASPIQAQEMTDVIDRLKARNALDWWPMALKIACDNNARKWSYVKAVLENALADGRAPGTNKPRTNGQAQRTKSYDNLAQCYSVPAGYEDVVNVDARTVAAPDPWRDLLAEADALAPMVRETPQVKERTLKQLTRKLDGILAALPLPYDAALAALGERLA